MGPERRAVGAAVPRGRPGPDYDAGALSCRRLRQNALIAHEPHFGLRALQCVAPKSISAWLKSNTWRCGSTAADTAHRCFLIAWLFGSPRPIKIRNSTRATFVSRIAARSRNAKLRIAPAVYSPMPLNDNSVS